MLKSLFQTLTVLALVTIPVSARPKSAATKAGKAGKADANSTTSDIIWDGRIPAGSASTLFDTANSPYGNSSVFGQNLTFGELIKMPTSNSTINTTSLFDAKTSTTPFEVTLSDASIFVPGGSTPQYGFRRAELNPNLNSTIGSTGVSGIKTFHFSVALDSARPLNYSHEYQIVFLETADYSNTQFTLKTGTILGGNGTADPKTLVLSGFGASTTLYETPFVEGWHNFGLVLNFNKNTTQVLYSQGMKALSNVTAALPNDLAGGGLYHIGMLKKPTGNTTDVVHSGYQESGIDEGLYYSGIFMEDSAKGVVTKSA